MVVDRLPESGSAVASAGDLCGAMSAQRESEQRSERRGEALVGGLTGVVGGGGDAGLVEVGA